MPLFQALSVIVSCGVLAFTDLNIEINYNYLNLVILVNIGNRFTRVWKNVLHEQKRRALAQDTGLANWCRLVLNHSSYEAGQISQEAGQQIERIAGC